MGLGASWALALFVEGFLFHVEPRDPASFLTVPAILVVVACLASGLPAWQAARVDPVEALRED